MCLRRESSSSLQGACAHNLNRLKFSANQGGAETGNRAAVFPWAVDNTQVAIIIQVDTIILDLGLVICLQLAQLFHTVIGHPCKTGPDWMILYHLL